MTFFTSTLVFVALIATALAMSASWGSRSSTDILLMNETVVRTPVANSFISVDVVFPKSVSYFFDFKRACSSYRNLLISYKFQGQTNTRNITAVFVYDRFTNTSGATPSLWSGGPGFTTTLVNLKSQLSRGMNSTVEIWGKK